MKFSGEIFINDTKPPLSCQHWGGEDIISGCFAKVVIGIRRKRPRGRPRDSGSLLSWRHWKIRYHRGTHRSRRCGDLRGKLALHRLSRSRPPRRVADYGRGAFHRSSRLPGGQRRAGLGGHPHPDTQIRRGAGVGASIGPGSDGGRNSPGAERRYRSAALRLPVDIANPGTDGLEILWSSTKAHVGKLSGECRCGGVRSSAGKRGYLAAGE